ncbi:hypothetical protein D3C72_2164030 [compost metagenome]
MQGLQAGRVGGEDPQLMLGTGHAQGLDLGAPGYGQQQQYQSGDQPPALPVFSADAFAVAPPVLELTPHRHDDEPGNFHGKQENPQ